MLKLATLLGKPLFLIYRLLKVHSGGYIKHEFISSMVAYVAP